MIGLLSRAVVVLTDSGGIQEECTVLSVPCMTLRSTTERPITIEIGSNTLVGLDASAVERAIRVVLDGHGKRGRIPEFWDGRACQRIAAQLANWQARRAAQESRAKARRLGTVATDATALNRSKG